MGRETLKNNETTNKSFRKTIKNNLLSIKRVKNVNTFKLQSDSNTFEMYSSHEKSTTNQDLHDDSNNNNTNQTTPENQSSVLIHKSLRFKITIVLIVMFLLLMATCLAILLTAFNISFLSVEYSMAIESAKRTSRTLFDDFYFLTSRVFEYGAFGDTVNVVTNSNSNATQLAAQYLNYYLHCQYQLSSRVNFALIYYLNGTLLNGLGCFRGFKLDKIPKDLQNLQSTELGRTLMDGISNPSTRNVGFYSPSESLLDLIVSNETIRGLNQYYNISNSKFLNLLLLSAMPIQDTDYNNSYGIMIFGRYQTKELFTDMSDRCQYCLTPYNLKDERDRYLFAKSLSSDKSTLELSNQQISTIIYEKTSTWTQTIIKGIYSQAGLWKNNTGQFIQQFSVSESELNLPIFENRLCSNSDLLYGSKVSIFQEYNDLISDGTMVIRTDFDREVYTLGITSFLITWSVMTVMIILLSVVLIIFLEFVVLKRLLRLTNAVRNITTSTNVKERVPHAGSDELGMLCDDVNNMLDALDATQTILSEDNQLMQQLLEKTSLSEQKSRVIMNSIDDFIFSVDSKTAQIVNYNTIFESRIFKKQFTLVTNYLKKPTLLGNEMDDLYNSIENPTKIIDELLQHLNQMTDTKSRWETTMLSNLGSEIPVSISASRVDIMLDEGNIHQVYVVVARNMSEQVELRQAVKLQEQRMEDFKMDMQFEKVMMDSNEREQFKKFCETEHSEENILFLEDILQYKSIKKTSDRGKKQSEILNKYLCDNSPTPINISQKVREKEVNNIREGYGQIDLFNNIEQVVKSMVIKDTFLRFSLLHNKRARATDNNDSLLSTSASSDGMNELFTNPSNSITTTNNTLDSPSILSSSSLISSSRTPFSNTAIFNGGSNSSPILSSPQRGHPLNISSSLTRKTSSILEQHHQEEQLDNIDSPNSVIIHL